MHRSGSSRRPGRLHGISVCGGVSRRARGARRPLPPGPSPGRCPRVGRLLLKYQIEKSMTCLNETFRPEGSPISWPHSSTPTPPFLVSHPLPLVTPWEKHWTVGTTSSATSLSGGLAPAPLGEWMHMADFNWLTLHTTFLRHRT